MGDLRKMSAHLDFITNHLLMCKGAAVFKGRLLFSLRPLTHTTGFQCNVFPPSEDN
jgi:hypothetical protein